MISFEQVAILIFCLVLRKKFPIMRNRRSFFLFNESKRKVVKNEAQIGFVDIGSGKFSNNS